MKLSRELAGHDLSSKRLAYAWQVEQYDPERHILMRQWLADNEVSIVDFLRKYIPKIRSEIGRDPLVEVSNPHARSESDAGGGYSPTRRALLVDDRPVLEGFLETTKRFTYETDQPVSWIRALDDSRWEARRQYEPQRSQWQSHRSWINRMIGDGAWTEVDRGPEGHAFGPFMELWDDGTIYLWCYQRALPFLRDNALVINGVPVQFTPEKVGVICRMVGHVDNMQAVLGDVQPDDSEAPETTSSPPSVSCRFSKRPGKPFHHPSQGSSLPSEFHRAQGSPLVIREYRDGSGQVRAWGNPSLTQGFELNGVQLGTLQPFNSGFACPVTPAELDSILQRQNAETVPEKTQATPAPHPLSGHVTDGATSYSPDSVVKALESALGRNVRLFGRSASDSAVVALTRSGLDKFLLEDPTDRGQYVTDTGGRNYDCENFSERLRVAPAAKYGVNGCMIIWGDGHAWCAFPVVSGAGPEIVMVEPQSDEVVTQLTGAYSVERRAEVLL